MLSRIYDFVMQMLSGGTMEIVLLIVIIIVALILLVLAVWLALKILVLLGKGIFWLAGWIAGRARAGSEARREAALGRPPPVATSWSASTKISLRGALAQARRVTGPDTFRIVVVEGKGMSDLCRSLGLMPPAAGMIGVAAGGDTILVDASNADTRALRRLAGALPWRRPADGIAVLVDTDGIPREAVARAVTFARASGFRTALHFVLPSASETAAWRIMDANHRDGQTVCTALASDTVRIWLGGGSREGMNELALAQSRNLPAALSRALAVAPSAILDVASLCFGGAGLRGAVAQTVERTRPAAAPGFTTWAGVAVFAAGLVLAALAFTVAEDRARTLDRLVDQAAREASVSWTAEGIDAVPSSARVRRVAGLGDRLSGLSEFSELVPLASVVPYNGAARRLGRAFLSGYVLRPLAVTLERKSREILAPSASPEEWVENARQVGEWVAAWEAMDEQPGEVDIQALLADAFGGDKDAWPEGIDGALVQADVRVPNAAEGGLDIDHLRTLAPSNFIATMQRWADTVYTNGPVATAARRATNRSASWREQHQALSELRTHLQDPTQQWLTATEDRSDHAVELRLLSRALGLALVGEVPVLEAKAAVARIRIDARGAAEYFLLPDIGPLLVRSGSGTGPNLSMTPAVHAWLRFLDKIAHSGFANLPADTAPRLVGPVTLDIATVHEARRRLQVFDQFASNLPADLPPSVSQALIQEVAGELIVGIADNVERAMRVAGELGLASERAERRMQVLPALEALLEIEDWLLERNGLAEAERVEAVRGRVAATVLSAAAEVLVEEDPLALPFDPTADANAMVRRFERGLSRLQRIHEQFAQPFVGAAEQFGDWNVVEWRDITTDIDRHRRGDAGADLSAIEGIVRAVAEDASGACESPRPQPSMRGDYIARSLARLRSDLDEFCGAEVYARIAAVYDRAQTYFDNHVAWLWPYANDDQAPELAASTLAAFLAELAAVRELPALPNAPLAGLFEESLDFWTVDTAGTPGVRFRIEWRTQRSQESLAEHVAEATLLGVDCDEERICTWRYGSPFGIRIRLAANSPYRFVPGRQTDGDDWTIAASGNGGFLRALGDSASGGLLTLAHEVRSADGDVRTLRVTARLSHPDGRALVLPRFAVPSGI